MCWKWASDSDAPAVISCEMKYDPALALVRFGAGLSPRFAPPAGVEAILADLSGPDDGAVMHPITGYADTIPSRKDLSEINQAFKDAMGTADEEAVTATRQEMRNQIRVVRQRHHKVTLARAIDTPFGVRDRLVAFWADHFTVERRPYETAHLVTSYVEDAIRPHVMGSFRGMLRAVVTHPMMLMYLQQFRSVGPNSDQGKRRRLGLNENLARELLELHLLGADGAYTQADVRELAELLTGLTYHNRDGFFYEASRAEPGVETVLGMQFGADAKLETVLDAMDQLAALPETAAHLAHKMAVHFVGGSPDPDLLRTMTGAFGAGDLAAMTTAMLTHPAAWTPTRAKVRTPQEFIIASLRALDAHVPTLVRMNRGTYNKLLQRPLRVMGQPWEAPGGPDGWPEDPAAWIIPQAMAGRISWAMQAPRAFRRNLPDPREFVRDALGGLATEDVIFAAGAAENRAEGVGVVLASAAFQRR